MNREILFKAKRIDNGEWVEGCIVIDQSRLDRFKYRIQPIESGVLYAHPIDPDTLCQYTGLTDKNGKKIWENDILKCKKYIGGNFVDYCIEVGYVEMKHGAFGLHRIKNDAYYRPFKDWLEDYEYEVVGNIFDNPELLEAE